MYSRLIGIVFAVFACLAVAAIAACDASSVLLCDQGECLCTPACGNGTTCVGGKCVSTKAACAAVTCGTNASCDASTGMCECSAGFTRNGGDCVACATCGTGQWESGACTTTQNTTCATCSTCAPGQAVTTACGAKNDVACNGCTPTCPAAQYESMPCANGADHVCAPCDASCASCSGGSATQCTACATGKYLALGACAACTACPAGTYASTPCSATADAVCSNCAVASHCATCTTNATTCDTCAPGFIKSGTTCIPATSCSALHTAQPALPSGVYTLNTGGADFQAYCEMVASGGGWTLALKLDGTKNTFFYDNAIWTNATLLNPTSPNIDTTEAKLETFNSVPAAEVRVVMVTAGVSSALNLTANAQNLKNLFSAGLTHTTAGRAAWKGLIANSSLQSNCNFEGFNTSTAIVKARIGIVGNQENDCFSTDSFVGVGANSTGVCDGQTAYAVGNAASCTPDNGLRSTQSFAYVYVRGAAPTSCSIRSHETVAPFGANAAFNNSLGTDFDVVTPVKVTQLGVYDADQNGITTATVAYIYNRDTSAVAAGPLAFAAGATGTLVNGYRYLPLATPVTLPAGFHGNVAVDAHGTDGLYLQNNNVIPGFLWGNDNHGLITFPNLVRTGTLGAYPATPAFPSSVVAAASMVYEADAVAGCR